MVSGKVNGAFRGNPVGGGVAMAMIGGTASALGGGKFANGARTAATQFLFNEVLTCASASVQCSFGGPSTHRPPGTVALKDNNGNHISWVSPDSPMLTTQGATASRIHMYGTDQDRQQAVEVFGLTVAVATSFISVPVSSLFAFGTSAYMDDKLGMFLAPLGVVTKGAPMIDSAVDAYDKINTAGTVAAEFEEASNR